jgi:uncharacterized peroxidase-related enzyme
MTWIRTISYHDAVGSLSKLYDRIKGTDDNVDNIMLAHSLRPHTMEAHMSMYKFVLHHPRNTIPKWFLEAIGTYTSILNQCHYCVEHHYTGMTRLLDDDARSRDIRVSLESSHWPGVFDEREAAALDYARKLSECPAGISEADIQSLRNVGWGGRRDSGNQSGHGLLQLCKSHRAWSGS